MENVTEVYACTLPFNRDSHITMYYCNIHLDEVSHEAIEIDGPF